MELWTDKGRRVSMPARSPKSGLLTHGMLRLEGLRQRLILPSNWRDGGEARQRRAWEHNTLPYEVKREPTSKVGQANLSLVSAAVHELGATQGRLKFQHPWKLSW